MGCGRQHIIAAMVVQQLATTGVRNQLVELGLWVRSGRLRNRNVPWQSDAMPKDRRIGSLIQRFPHIT
jgi:hypothetical protein